jgi:predicted nucleotidyltransferase
MGSAPPISEVARRIADAFRPRRIILFGSHARGEATAGSDLDLFVEMETTQRPPERAVAVGAIFGMRDWPLDVVVYTPEEVNQLRGIRGTLLSIIESEGKVLYQRV